MGHVDMGRGLPIVKTSPTNTTDQPREWQSIREDERTEDPLALGNSTTSDSHSSVGSSDTCSDSRMRNEQFVVTTCSTVRVNDATEYATLRHRLSESETISANVSRKLKFAGVKLAAKDAQIISQKRELLNMRKKVQDLGDHVKFLRHITAPTPDAGALDASISMLRGQELETTHLQHQQAVAMNMKLEIENHKLAQELEASREEVATTTESYKETISRLDQDVARLSVLSNAKDRAIEELEQRIVMQGEMYEEQLNELKTSLQTMNTTLKESNEREANLATVVREYEDKNVQLNEKIMDVEQQLENARNSINEQEEEIKFLNAEVSGLQGVVGANTNDFNETNFVNLSSQQVEEMLQEQDAKHKEIVQRLEEQISELLAEQAFEHDPESTVLDQLECTDPDQTQLETAIVPLSLDQEEHQTDASNMDHLFRRTKSELVDSSTNTEEQYLQRNNEEVAALEDRVDKIQEAFLAMVTRAKQFAASEAAAKQKLKEQQEAFETALSTQRMELANTVQRCERLSASKEALERQLARARSSIEEHTTQDMFDGTLRNQLLLSKVFRDWKLRCCVAEGNKKLLRSAKAHCATQAAAQAELIRLQRDSESVHAMHVREVTSLAAAVSGSKRCVAYMESSMLALEHEIQRCQAKLEERKVANTADKETENVEQSHMSSVSTQTSDDKLVPKDELKKLENYWRNKRDKALMQQEKKLTFAFKKQLVKVLKDRESVAANSAAVVAQKPVDLAFSSDSVQHKNKDANKKKNVLNHIQKALRTHSSVGEKHLVNNSQVTVVSEMASTLSRIRREALEDVSALSAVSSFTNFSGTGGSSNSRKYRSQFSPFRIR